MNDSETLICPLCDKVSENKKSHIRHKSYCRKKSKRPARTRRRSCFACIKAKTHCDAALAAPCSRCTTKGIQCDLASSQSRERPEASLEPSHGGSHEETSIVVTVDGKCSSWDIQTTSEPLLADWSQSYASSASSDDMEILINSQKLPSTSSATSLVPLNPWVQGPSIAVSTHFTNTSTWSIPNSFATPWSNVHPYAVGPQLKLGFDRAFAPKRPRSKEMSLISKYIGSTLRKYPAMMLDATPPPFIYHQCMASKGHFEPNALPGPLPRCSGIVAMWSTKNANNQHYVWKILRIEQERLSEEIDVYDDMMAVNALQAITIYMLLRVSCPNDELANFDLPLIRTMSKLAMKVRGLTKRYRGPEFAMPSHADWVLVESLNRTISVLFIIEYLFDLAPGMGAQRCDSIKFWSEMLLPSSKALWEAVSELEWERAYAVSDNDRRPYYGELMRHEQLVRGRAQLLDRWMSEVDDFGTLVINAASIAEAVH